MRKENIYFSGRGAQLNTPNRFNTQTYVNAFPEINDEEMLQAEQTHYIVVFPKTIVKKVKSRDILGKYSMNP